LPCRDHTYAVAPLRVITPRQPSHLGSHTQPPRRASGPGNALTDLASCTRTGPRRSAGNPTGDAPQQAGHQVTSRNIRPVGRSGSGRVTPEQPHRSSTAQSPRALISSSATGV
jgi:hypothetical protein